MLLHGLLYSGNCAIIQAVQHEEIMGKATYLITVVKPGRWDDYKAVEIEGKSHSEDGVPYNSKDSFINDTVAASSKDEAHRLMRQKYPGHTIDTAATVVAP